MNVQPHLKLILSIKVVSLYPIIRYNTFLKKYTKINKLFYYITLSILLESLQLVNPDYSAHYKIIMRILTH